MSRIDPFAAVERTGLDSPFSLTRVGAMVQRYIYLLLGSLPRAIDLIYWPTVQMVLWGFMSQFLYTNSSYVAQAFGVLLAAILLWDVFFRGQLGFALSFLEEMWSRNLGHLFVSPLRPAEWVASLLIMSFLRVAIGIVPAALLAIPLYSYSVFSLGLPLVAFFADLMIFAWALGLVTTALILRYGVAAENFAWSSVFLLAPVSAVYYPVSVLPPWLQPIAEALPTSHVFEGMRGVMFQHHFSWGSFAAATALDLVYVAIGCAIFLLSFRNARNRGALLQTGE